MLRQDVLVGDDMPAYHCAPSDDQIYPAIILIHEIWGLSGHIRDVAERLCREGYVVLAPDVFYDIAFEGHVDQSVLGEMQDPATRDEAQKKMRTLMAPLQAPGFAEKILEKLRSCTESLLKDPLAENEAIGVMGFCFGGTYSFALAAHDTRIRACVAFYGHPPLKEDIARITSPILAFYGEKDEGLTVSLPGLKETMRERNKDFTAVVYPGVGHAFFNDTNPVTYNAETAKDAWQKTLSFLSKHLTRA